MAAIVASTGIRPGCRLALILLAFSGFLPGSSGTVVHAQETTAESTAAALPDADTSDGAAPAAPAESDHLDRPFSPPVRVLQAGGLSAETVVLILGGQQGGGLLFEPLVLPVAIDGRIPFWLEIDGTDLLTEQEDPTLRLEIYVYALNAEGGVEDALLKVVTFDLERVGEQDGAQRRESGRQPEAIRWSPLPPHPRPQPRYEHGRSACPVSGGRRQGPPAGDPAAAPAAGTRRQLAAGRSAASPAEATMWGDAIIGGKPSARPVVLAGQEIGFTLLSSALPPTATLVLDVMRFDSTPVTRISIRSSLRERTAAIGWSRSRATFSTDDLGPGDYLVRVLSENGKSIWSGSLPVHVLVQPYDHDVVWAELTGDAAALSFGAKEFEEKPIQERLALPIETFRKGYLATLELLAEGRLQASIRALSELQTAALDGSGVALDRLRKVEIKIVKRLAREDPELLLPVLQLYQGLYEQKYTQRQFLLSTHARRMIMALIGLYADLGDPDTARPVASSILAALAARLQAAGMPTFSGEIFGRALQLDAENRTSLLCLATGFERRGMYPEAVEYLRRLVTADPEHWEGQLRLALNLKRTHHFDETEPLLRRILAKSTEDWVTVVAHQELAAAYVQRGRTDDAEEVLRQGMERFPDDQKLRLLSAFLLESGHEPTAARELLEKPVNRDFATHSPRYQYSRLPADELASDRLELEALAQAKLIDLQEALARQQSGGAS